MNLYFRLFLTLLRRLWRPALATGTADVAHWRDAEQSMIDLARERTANA